MLFFEIIPSRQRQIQYTPTLDVQPYIHVESFIEGTYYVGVRVNDIIEDLIVTNQEGTNYVNTMLDNATNVLREKYPNHKIVVKEIDYAR
jgi:hypothetical protein